MGSSGSALNETEKDTRGVFSRLEEPYTPLSAAEVAEKLDCPDGTAKQHLEALTVCCELPTRRVDGQRQVWWSTDHVEATDEGSELEEYEAFIHAVEDDAIFMLNPDGTVASWNEGAERIKGYREDEIVGEHFSTIYTDTDINAGDPDANATAATSGSNPNSARARPSPSHCRIVVSTVSDQDTPVDSELDIPSAPSEKESLEGTHGLHSEKWHARD